ncbi:MAG: pilus assembly protein TadG-related protein [Acidobacteriota bacterium]
MTRHVSHRRRGQALVMVTLALIAMFSIIGLAVDLGWSYFTRKAQRAAAEAAALAAVTETLNIIGPGGTYTCGGHGATCAPAPVACPGAAGNLTSACLYASLNGFAAGANTAVTVQASDRVTPPTVTGCSPLVNHPPTAPCVDTPYWVTVRVSQSVPQLFSGVLGNSMGTVSARATAAVAKSLVIGSLILLNRQGESGPYATGNNLHLGGSPNVIARGGILMASNDRAAGYINGSGTVTAPFTYIRTGGDIAGKTGQWQDPPENRPDGSGFYDPFRGMGQPPLNPNQASLPYIAVPGGTLSCASVCQPGNYYATSNGRPSGQPITIAGDGSFANGATGSTAFGDYVFFGGLSIGHATVNFGPGRYVLAGALSGKLLWDSSNQAQLYGGSATNPDAGRIFILTDSSYGGALSAVAAAVPGGLPALTFGGTEFKAGSNSKSKVDLYGLNPESTLLPANLANFAPVVMWQDQANSNVKYTSSGDIDTSCGSLDKPCTNPTSPARELNFWAGQDAHWGGAIYQPRGAWSVVHATPGYKGALQIVTGAMDLQGSGDLELTSPTHPIERYVAALVE